MAGSIDTIASDAMHLPPDQRLTLAHRILSSMEPAVTSEIEAAWDAEIRQRVARYYAGEVRSIPAAEVFAEVDRQMQRCLRPDAEPTGFLDRSETDYLPLSH